MSRKFKMNDTKGIYFVSFAAIYWTDVFVRQQYFKLVADGVIAEIKDH